IPDDILVLEGQLEALPQAIQELEAETHASLQPAQQALRQAEEQAQRLQADVEANEPAWPEGTRQRFEEAMAQEPIKSLADLCALVPEMPTATVLTFINRLRNAERARQALASVLSQYEIARTAQIHALRQQLEKGRQELLAKHEQDFKEVLTALFE